MGSGQPWWREGERGFVLAGGVGQLAI